MKSLGDTLKELRLEKDITLEQLANDLNNIYGTTLNKGMISKWESNKSEPRFEYARYLADYYKVTLDYLLGVENKNDRKKEIETIAAHLEEKNLTPKKLKLLNDYIEALFDE